MLFNAKKELVNSDTQNNAAHDVLFDDEDDIFGYKQYQKPALVTQAPPSPTPLTQADLDPFYEPGNKSRSYELQYVRDLNLDPNFRVGQQGENAFLYQWNGSYWQRLSDAEARRKAWAWLIKFAPKNAKAKDAASLHASALLGVKKLPAAATFSLVPMEDAWLAIGEDGQFWARKPDPSIGVTYQINTSLQVVDFGQPYQPAPLPAHSHFARFLSLSLPDVAERQLVQEYCGYTLLNDVRFQVAQVWVGDGCNGKSVLLKIIEQLHAKVGSILLDQLRGFGLAPLVDASLLVCSEAPRRGIDEQTFKQIISGDPLTIEYKFKDQFMYSPRAKLLIACNRFPHVTDDSNGVWRRLQIIRWGVNLTKEQQVTNLDQLIVDQELKLVVDWCLEGLARLLKRGEFNEPASVRTQKDLEKTQSNNVLGFVEDSGLAVSISGDTVLKEKVYQRYEDYCLANGLTPFHGTEFWKRMGGIFKEMKSKKKTVGNRRPYAVNLAFGEDVAAVAALHDNPFNEQ